MADPVTQKIRTFFREMGWEEPLSKQKWWVLLRWILMGVVVLTTLISHFLIHLDIPVLSVFFICVCIFLFNSLLHYRFFFQGKGPASADKGSFDGLIYIQFAADWIFITLIFHFTGGIASPLLFYFLLHVILSAVLLERWGSLLYVTLVAVTFSCISLLELGEVIPHFYGASFISPAIQRNVSFVLMLLVYCNLALYISSAFVSSMLERSKERIVKLTDLRQELERTNSQLGLLNKVARDTNLTLGLNPRLSFICRSITDIMGIKGTAIRLLDEKTNRLELVASCGLSDAYINKGPVEADKSLARALAGEPHFVPDAATDPSVQYPEAARNEGIVSMLAVPLKGREKVIGTMRLFTSEMRTLSRNELDLIYALAAQGAISIENAKIYDVMEKQDRTKSEFIMLMTHELKGPLMAIQSLIEVMLKGYVGSLEDKQKELVERIDKRIESVMEVSTQLLDIYQWQSQRPDSKWVPLSMKEQVQRAVDLFRTSAQEKGLDLQVDLPEEDPVVMGTEEEMEKILNNLITNAIKYTPAGGNISLTLSVKDARILLGVRDTGIGIASEDIPRIFNDFFRTSRAKQIDPYGRGIGLPFVKRVVENLGGTILATSEEGVGTEFSVSFPIAARPQS